MAAYPPDFFRNVFSEAPPLVSNFYIILALIKLLGSYLKAINLLFLDWELSNAQYEFQTRKTHGSLANFSD